MPKYEKLYQTLELLFRSKRGVINISKEHSKATIEHLESHYALVRTLRELISTLTVEQQAELVFSLFQELSSLFDMSTQEGEDRFRAFLLVHVASALKDEEYMGRLLVDQENDLPPDGVE